MKNLIKTLGVIAILAAVFVQTGCETESASDNSLRVSPGRAKITNGQRIQFTASGGFDYSWAISDSTLGFLSSKVGASTVYTANFTAPTDGLTVQTLTVTSVVGSGGSNNTTTASGFTKTADAIIEHTPAEPAEPAEPVLGTLAMSPSSGATLSAAGNQLFTATGAGPNYGWTLSDASNGNISTTTGSFTVYTYQTLVLANKTITLTVSSNGKSVTVPILLTPTPAGP
jgi:hypothetical protein